MELYWFIVEDLYKNDNKLKLQVYSTISVTLMRTITMYLVMTRIKRTTF